MRRANQTLALLSAGILGLVSLAHGAPLKPTGYLVTVDTSSVSGQQGTIDLQFNAGALTTQNACVNVSYLTGATLGPPSSTAGGVTGTLASTLTINNGNGGCSSATTYTASTVNDYNQPITFGNTLSFYLTLNGPGVTAPAGNSNGNSGSSFGVDFTITGSPALTGDPSNYAGTISLNPDGTVTTVGLPGPGDTTSLVTIQPADLVTVGTSPSGLSFTVDTNAYTTSQTFAWAIGSQHTLAATTPQGSSGTRYTFTGWSDGTNSPTDQVTVSTGTSSYTANFSTSYLLTTAASPSADGSVGINPPSPTSDGYYASGTQVTLTATANTGYNFSNWSGTTTSSTNPLMITMNSPVSETANFGINNVNVTIGTSPSGLLVSVDGGAAQTAPVNTSWQVGTKHTIATTSPQGSSGTLYTFTGWSDAGTISHQVTASSSVTSYTASFSTSYLLTTSASPSGDGTVGVSSNSTPTNGYYPAGAQVTLTGTPATNYKFVNWTGTTSSTTNPLVVTMNSPVSETANFTLNNVAVTIATSPTGLLVSIDNGSPQAAPVNTSWVIGSQHTIATTSPQTASGTMYTFSKWSDGGAISHTVNTPGTAVTYTATFSVQYQLTTGVSPSGSGTVTPASGGYYAPGTVVNLKASPSNGYIFQSWTGPVANAKSASTTVTMSAPETVTANFTEGPTLLVAIITNKQGPESARRWTFTVANSGPGAANGAQISSLKLTQTSGSACTVAITTPLPISLGNLTPFSATNTTVTINFGSCASRDTFTVSGTLTANQGRASSPIFLPLLTP